MQEAITYISALDVYDRYGLAVCSSYLKSLYSAVASGTYSATSLLMYTIASLAELDMELAQSYSVQLKYKDKAHFSLRYCCYEFLLLLRQFDDKQPKLATELQEVTIELPVGVLAMICRSNRVSRATAKSFIAMRLKNRSCMLREGELAARCQHVISAHSWTCSCYLQLKSR